MKLHERPPVLTGSTYKIKPPTIDHAVYITINNGVIDGQTRPVELFISSRDMASFQWVTCVARLVSAQLRLSGEFPGFVVKELLTTHDPMGGYIVPQSKGFRAPSIVAHIGWILERHCAEMGLMK